MSIQKHKRPVTVCVTMSEWELWWLSKLAAEQLRDAQHELLAMLRARMVEAGVATWAMNKIVTFDQPREQGEVGKEAEYGAD